MKSTVIRLVGLAFVALTTHRAAGVAGDAETEVKEKFKALQAAIKAKDGAKIFCKDWGPKTAQPIVFHHGWPLSADDWDNQMMFFLGEGYRVIAHDRRGHGRSSQTDGGNDMESYASDVAALVAELDLKDAIQGFGADAIVNNCVAHTTATSVAPSCALVRRNPAGSLWLTATGFIIDTPSNSA